MFSRPPRTLNPLVTDIENLASSCFLKIAALFVKLQRLARMRPPANASSCALASKLAKAELTRVSPNQIGHSADDKDDEENQTHLKQRVLERDAYLHCAQCCHVMIDRKAVFSSLAKPSRGLAAPKRQSRCFTTR